MSINISKTALYVKDKNSGELKSIGLFSSGADKTLTEISEYAEEVKTNTNASILGKVEEVLEEIDSKVQESIDSIPEDYTEINNKVNNLKTEIKITNSRIDTFTSLTDGSTTGDAELMDIRVGANGKTYDSAGTAVREQISELSSEIDKYYLSKKTGKNIFNKDLGYVDGYLTKNGTILPHDVLKVCDYFEIEPNTEYAISGYPNNGGYMSFYDNNRNFILGISMNVNAPIIFTTPVNTWYCRITLKIDNFSTVQIEKGNTVTPYEEYSEYFPLKVVEDEVKRISKDLGTTNNNSDELKKELLGAIKPFNMFSILYSKVLRDCRISNSSTTIIPSIGKNDLYIIPVSENKKYYLSRPNNARNTIIFTDSEGNYLSSYVDNEFLYDSIFTPPVNASYIWITHEKNNYPNAFICEAIYLQYILYGCNFNFEKELVEIKSDSNSLKKELISPKNLWNKDSEQHGVYIATLYNPQPNENYQSNTEYIPVSEGDVIVSSGTELSGLSRVRIGMRFVIAYNEDKIVLTDLSKLSEISTYTVPSGVSFIRITVRDLFRDIMVEKSTDGSISPNYEEYFEPYHTIYDFKRVQEKVDNLALVDNKEFNIIKSESVNGTGIRLQADTLSDGDIIESELNAIKKNKHLSFFTEITEFGSVMIGHGEKSYTGDYIVIDSENVYKYSYATGATLNKTYAHGLTITNFLNVIINVDNTGNASIVLFSDSGSYNIEKVGWTGSNGTIFARSVGSSLSNVKLSWTSDDYKSPIWAFGDSYFSMNSGMRWTSYMPKWGYDNWMVDGWSGRGSVQALDCLKKKS